MLIGLKILFNISYWNIGKISCHSNTSANGANLITESMYNHITTTLFLSILLYTST